MQASLRMNLIRPPVKDNAQFGFRFFGRRLCHKFRESQCTLAAKNKCRFLATLPSFLRAGGMTVAGFDEVENGCAGRPFARALRGKGHDEHSFAAHSFWFFSSKSRARAARPQR